MNPITPIGLAILAGAGCAMREILLTALFYLLTCAFASFLCQRLTVSRMGLLGGACLLVCSGTAVGVMLQSGTSLGIYLNLLFSGMSAIGTVTSLRLLEEGLRSEDTTDMVSAWGVFVACLALLVLLSQVFCMAVRTTAALVSVAAVLLLFGAADLFACRMPRAAGHAAPGGGGFSGEGGPDAMFFVHFGVFGLGTSCYISLPFIAAYENVGAEAVRDPIWWVLVLSACACAVATTVAISRLAQDGSSLGMYGRVVRNIIPVCAILTPLAIIAHVHVPLLGSVMLPLLPAIAVFSLSVMVLQIYGHVGVGLAGIELGLMCYISLGAAVGLLAIIALWQIGDVMLRYQLIALLTVVTCVWAVPRLPRRTVSGDELLKQEFAEDLSGEQRLERRIADVAAQGSLTPRETQVLELLAQAKSQQEIAAELGISLRTAQNHTASIHRKLDVHSLGELIRFMSDGS